MAHISEFGSDTGTAAVYQDWKIEIIFIYFGVL